MVSPLKIRFSNLYRWYLLDARHPLKDKIVGKFWPFFSRIRVWVQFSDAEIFIFVNSRDYIEQQIFIHGIYERTMLAFLRDNLCQEDCFWDVGANIGVVSLYASKRAGKVVAFEADPSCVTRLTTHAVVNEITNIEVVDKAISNNVGQVWLGFGPDTNRGMNSIVRQSDDGVLVSSLTLDSYYAETQECPVGIKLDVEGGELLVLKGATKVLENPTLKWIILEAEIENGALANNDILELLSSHGFSRVKELGRSDQTANDTVSNFLVTRT